MRSVPLTPLLAATALFSRSLSAPTGLDLNHGLENVSQAASSSTGQSFKLFGQVIAGAGHSTPGRAASSTHPGFGLRLFGQDVGPSAAPRQFHQVALAPFTAGAHPGVQPGSQLDQLASHTVGPSTSPRPGPSTSPRPQAIVTGHESRAELSGGHLGPASPHSSGSGESQHSERMRDGVATTSLPLRSGAPSRSPLDVLARMDVDIGVSRAKKKLQERKAGRSTEPKLKGGGGKSKYSGNVSQKTLKFWADAPYRARQRLEEARVTEESGSQALKDLEKECRLIETEVKRCRGHAHGWAIKNRVEGKLNKEDEYTASLPKGRSKAHRMKASNNRWQKFHRAVADLKAKYGPEDQPLWVGQHSVPGERPSPLEAGPSNGGGQ